MNIHHHNTFCMYIQYIYIYIIQIYLKKGMKIQHEILKILNTYNDEAKINDKEIYEKKKLLYHKEINLTDRVDSWRKGIFALKPYNIHFLNSVFLNDNPQFKEIKVIFNKYNQQVANFEEGHVDADHLRPMVMQSLLKFMRLVMLTEDRQAQLRLLKASHEWLMQKLDPSEKYDSKYDYTKELDQRLEKVKVNDSNKMLSKMNENLPSEQMKNQRYDFYRKFRTQHSEIEPPADRIKNYKPRILNLEDPDKHKKVVTNELNTRIKYEKQLSYKKVKKIDQEEKKDSLVVPENIDTALMLDQQVNPPVLPGTEQNKEGGPEGGAVVAAEQQFQEPQLGEQAQPDQQEQQIPDQPQEGKLNPRIKNYIYPAKNYDNKALVSMEDRFLKQYQKVQRGIIEDNSKVDQVREWAKKKARFESEAHRKLQSIREMARLNVSNGQAFSKQKKDHKDNERTISFMLDEKQQSKDKDYFEFESKINQQVLEQTKKFSGKQVHLLKNQKLNPQEGLSLYDRKRIKTEISYENKKKPFSAILHDYSKEKERENSMDEINQIKERFAKYKINIQMKRIGDGILPPVEIQDEDLQKINKYEADLPNNPFFKVGKKKKKKKKKKN